MESVRHLDQRSQGRLVVGFMSLAGAVGYMWQAGQLPLGDMRSPGPGMYPMGVGVLWMLASAVVLGEALFSKADVGDVDLPIGRARRQALIFMGTLVVFVLVLPLIGFPIAATLYAVACLKFLGALTWVRSIVYGVAMGVVVSFVFGWLLAVPLPVAGW
ncbi:tripartite tricarboxylate transporter TctB family protein [Aeromicrobium sp. CF4.19]|uniref:tripartite tricarboxylate transporter TctB family protein n=1 Tax=Aeromicrobium sp. CF4.19 TaxID=3373082 RepID=UPI003EE44311